MHKTSNDQCHAQHTIFRQSFKERHVPSKQKDSFYFNRVWKRLWCRLINGQFSFLSFYFYVVPKEKLFLHKHLILKMPFFPFSRDIYNFLSRPRRGRTSVLQVLPLWQRLNQMLPLLKNSSEIDVHRNNRKNRWLKKRHNYKNIYLYIFLFLMAWPSRDLDQVGTL